MPPAGTDVNVDALDDLVGVPVRHHRVPQPWGTQHVVEAGDREAPPVLLVHGWPQHWVAWRHLLGPLSAGRRVLAVDLRGFGWSVGATDGGDVVGRHVADLVAVLDAFDVDRAALVSHDWGGWIAFRAVERHADRFATHAALAIMPPWLDARSLRRHLIDWSYVFPMAAAGRLIARRASWVRAMLHRTTHDPLRWDAPGERAALASYLARVARPESAAMTRALYAAFVRRELPAAVGGRTSWSTVPTTVVVGEHETIARPAHWWRRTRAGELRLVTIPAADHWLAEEAPVLVADAVEVAISV